ncbi:pyruvate dehydrogenase [Nocardia jejuensis]|uniref:pyruvate dehydrogenase n=1 Tax=Nocardia jejuensis TaxID=328049 RepID=UPI00083635D5|nr:pyruvate dehydrogenase [Nocardia jejuensis]
MGRNSVASQLVEVLVAAGVERVYGLVGDSLNPFVDALRRTGGIEWVHCHNEESAAFAAGAESLLTGKLAVCAASCGPGNTHLIQGLFDAHRNGASVLAIASHIPSREIGTGFFQETHPERLFVECSHFCELISTPEQMPRLAYIAMQTALGARGVSVLVLPGDVLHEDAENRGWRSDLVAGSATAVPPAPQVDRLAEAINDAETVTLFAGAGVRGAHLEVMELAAKLHAPVGHALGGKEWIQFDNPYDVGMSGLLGYGAAYEAMNEADLLIMLGTDFPYDTFLPRNGRIAQIDRDPSRIGRRAAIDIAVHGDVAATIADLLPLVQQKPNRAFLDDMLRRHLSSLENVVDAYTHDIDHHTPIHPEYVAAVLDEIAADDAVFTVDTGMCNVWAARYLSPNGRRRIIGSWRHGTMANALPHAIGAQSAFPGRQVISLSGDGGLAMLMGELLTVWRHRLPVKIVVFNNSSLGMVKLEMLVDGLPDYGTDHEPVNYADIAAAVGIASFRVTDPTKVRAALSDAFAEPGPALIDVVTDPNALSLPPKLDASQVKGFALAAGKIVLAGGVGRMVDLARANLRNIPRP